MSRILPAILGLVIALSATSVIAGVPDSLQITCDVDRTAFRKLAATPSSITFRLWDAVSGGSQCGTDHVVLMEKVLALRPKGDKFDGQRPRKFLELRAVLGTDGDSGTPVDLCVGDETWLDVTVGSTTLTCEFSADPNSKQGVSPDAPARRRLQSVAFAQESSHSETCDECTTTKDISVRVFNSGSQSIPSATTAVLTFDSERWDTDGIHDPTINASRLTCQTAGKYLIFTHFAFESNVTGDRFASIRLNGTTEIGRLKV